MSNATLVFVRKGTDERKEFTEDKYEIDTTTQHNEQFRSTAYVSCYRSQDGDRIDRQPDGSYRDKWGTIWDPEPTQ